MTPKADTQGDKIVNVDIDICFIKTNTLKVTLTVPEDERYPDFSLKAMREDLNGAVAYRSHRQINHYDATVIYKWKDWSVKRINPIKHLEMTLDELKHSFLFFDLDGYDVNARNITVNTNH